MSNQPDLSIIILSYKMDGLVKNCLKSIFAHPTKKKLEVIVVDNGSEDQCEALVKTHFPQVKFIQTGANLGHAGGNNAGIRESNGRYVMILNPDVVFLEPIFDRLVDFLDEQKKIGMTTVQLRYPDGTIQAGAWRFHSFLTPLYQRSRILSSLQSVKKKNDHFLIDEWDRTTSRPVDWVQGSCLVVRREALTKIGLLDENLFLYFTDVDWCRRCWEENWSVYYYADVQAIHYYNRESAHKEGIKSLFHPATRLHIKDWMRYLRKYWRLSHPKRT